MLDKLYVRHIDLGLTDELKKLYVHLMVNDHRNADYKNGNSYYLDDKYSYLTSKLYDIFEQESRKIFNNFYLSTTSNKNCWAYVTNMHEYRNGIHDHRRSATINGVYYFNVPSDISGEINFYNDNRELTYSHFPKEGELIIFPYYMLHEPQKSLTEDYRIAINVEIICNEVWK